MLTEYADDLSVSQKAINGPDQIAKIRKLRAQQQREAKAAQVATHTLPRSPARPRTCGDRGLGGD